MQITNKNTSFKKNIILILTLVYENTPSCTRFDIALTETLTGFTYKDHEEDILSFLETIDYLVRENYLKCDSCYVRNGSMGQRIIQLHQPVFISEYGIKKLESIDVENTTKKQRYIDRFKKISNSLMRKAAESGTDVAVRLLLHNFWHNT